MTNEYIIRDEAMTLPVLPKEQRIRLDSIDEAFEEGWRQALENLAILPTADVVPVVRCADCEYYSEPGWCKNPNTFAILTRGNTSPDWFCADGKRKDGGHEDV